MLRKLLPLFIVAFSATFVLGQTVIVDNETPGTTTQFRYFANVPLDGQLTNVIPNPDMSGINTSATIGEFVKTPAGATFAGAFADPIPATPVDFTSGNTQICVDVWMPIITNLSLKLEQSTTAGPNWIGEATNTKVNEWERLCFQASAPSFEPPFTSAIGDSYNQIVLFFDFGNAGGPQQTYFFDNIVTSPPDPVAAIPTMGQWSLFCLALIMLIVGVVFVTQMQSQMAVSGAGNTNGNFRFSIRQFPFDRAGYGKAFKTTLLIVPLAFGFIYAVWGEIILDDLVGMVMAIPLVAYLIYLIKK
jgi:hypothetical protein